MNTHNISEHPETYDAIVIVTGMADGSAAIELCENGLKTLILKRGQT